MQEITHLIATYDTHRFADVYTYDPDTVFMSFTTQHVMSFLRNCVRGGGLCHLSVATDV